MRLVTLESPSPPLFYPGFPLPRSSEPPPPFFTPSHDGVSQEDDVFLSFFSLLKYQGIMAMGVHVCFYTHTWENVCGRVCVCVWPDVPSTPEQSLKLFFLFLYCHHYWSGGAGKPTVYGGPTPRLHDLLCSIRWVEWGGGEPRASWHGDDWLQPSSRTPSLIICPFFFFFSCLHNVNKLLMGCSKCWSVITSHVRKRKLYNVTEQKDVVSDEHCCHRTPHV